MKRMKRWVSILLALCMMFVLVPTTVLAADEVDSGTCGENLTWVLDDEGTLTISGTGEMTEELWTAPWDTYQDDIRTVIIEDGVTSIGGSAFYEYSSITSVTIPGSVTSIGKWAFSYCSALKEIVFEGDAPEIIVAFLGVTANAYCPEDNPTWTADKKVGYGGLLTWNSGVAENESASGTCGENLTWVLENGTLTISGEGEMTDSPWSEYNAQIRNVVIEDGVTSIDNYAFRNCTFLANVSIPDSVASIGDAAFYSCASLTNINIPDSVAYIGERAFGYCTSLTGIELPKGITSIEKGAFAYCDSLTNVSIPDGVTAIKGAAFEGCISLPSVVIPASVDSIEVNAFHKCYSMEEIVFVGNAPAIDEYAFRGAAVTAYYPEGNETWTEDKLADYGGTIFWTPYTSLAGITASSNATNVGKTVYVTVNTAHASDATYAAAELILGYDTNMLKFNEEESDLNKASVQVDDSGLKLEHYGEKKALGAIYVLAFDMLEEGEATITLESAAFVDLEDAAANDLIPALLAPDTVSLKIGGELFDVTFPSEDIIGNPQVENGKDYTFTVKGYDRYNYTITATVDGAPVTVIDNGDGTYTIENVTGALEIFVEKTPREFTVAFTGTGAEDVVDAPTTATYLTDYTFTLPYVLGSSYKVGVVTIGDKAYTGFTVENNVCTIPGTDIAGNIIIEIVKGIGDIPVSFEGNAVGSVTSAPVAIAGQPYTLTLLREPGYLYTVTATMNGEPVELIVQGDTYIIENVTGPITFTVTREVAKQGRVRISEYVSLDGTKMHLVRFETIVADGAVPVYDGNAMFWSDRYGAYCWLVVADTLSVEEAFAALDISYVGSVGSIEYDLDVNITGKVDASDAQLVYNMYNVNYSDFTEVSVEKFLRADVNGDRKVDVEDAAAIINYILTGKEPEFVDDEVRYEMKGSEGPRFTVKASNRFYKDQGSTETFVLYYGDETVTEFEVFSWNEGILTAENVDGKIFVQFLAPGETLLGIIANGETAVTTIGVNAVQDEPLPDVEVEEG